MSKGFINLAKQPESIAISSDMKESEPRGPSFYVSGIELPIEGTDVIKATVMLKPSVTMRDTDGKKDYSYDFEVKSIKFGDKDDS